MPASSAAAAGSRQPVAAAVAAAAGAAASGKAAAADAEGWPGAVLRGPGAVPGALLLPWPGAGLETAAGLLLAGRCWQGARAGHCPGQPGLQLGQKPKPS